MAKKDETTGVVKQEHHGLVHEELPDYLKGKEGLGSENVTLKNVTIPRLAIVQKLSPQLDESSSKYIHGVKEGDVLNTLTQENYGKEVLFVDAFFREEWMVAVPIKEGGGGGKGFRGIFTTLAEAKERIADNPKAEKLEAIELGVHYGLVLNEKREVLTMIALPMKSSQLKESRRLNGLVKQKGGPQWAAIWKLETVSETNAANQSYKNFKVTPTAGFTPSAIAEMAEKLWKDVSGAKLTMDTGGLDGELEPETDRTDL